MDGTHDVEPGDPDVVFCVDEFGPLNLQPHPAAIGQSKVVEAPSPGGVAGRPTPAHTACATCWPPMT
jgi:hypothetical protein